MIKTVKVSHESRTLSLGKAGTYGLGVENDNLYDTLYFQFDEMVDGQGSLLTSLEDTNGDYIAFPLTKEEDGYSIVLTDIMLTVDQFVIQLMVTNGEVVWHSVQAKVKVKPCLEAGQGEMPTAVEIWLEEADAKLAELNAAITQAGNLNASVEKVDNKTTITITDKDGVATSCDVLDGVDGNDGQQGPQGPQGPTGPAGKDGKDGTNGQDGYSPTITSSKSGKVTTLTITDATGTSTATINDGADGTTPDMSDYVKNTDYATDSKGGVIKTSVYYGTGIMDGGKLAAENAEYSYYQGMGNHFFIGKGTLENVITGKGLGNYDNLVNKPITNLNGSSGSPVIFANLTTGYYLIDGYWKISSDSGGTLTNGVTLFFIANIPNTYIYYQDFNSFEMAGYAYVDGYWNNDYYDQIATKSYVDSKISDALGGSY